MKRPSKKNFSSKLPIFLTNALLIKQVYNLNLLVFILTIKNVAFKETFSSKQNLCS